LQHLNFERIKQEILPKVCATCKKLGNCQRAKSAVDKRISIIEHSCKDWQEQDKIKAMAVMQAIKICGTGIEYNIAEKGVK
jgi:hypothetical protein